MLTFRRKRGEIPEVVVCIDLKGDSSHRTRQCRQLRLVVEVDD